MNSAKRAGRAHQELYLGPPGSLQDLSQDLLNAMVYGPGFGYASYQFGGLEQIYTEDRQARLKKAYRNAHPKVLALIEKIGVTLEMPPSGFEAFHPSTGLGEYYPITNIIRAQDRETTTGNLTSYLLHEIVHWTGHWGRMNRYLFEGMSKGEIRDPQAEADEEYTAQAGMVILMAELEIKSIEMPPIWLRDYYHIIQKSQGETPNVEKATEEAYRAVGYLRMIAPEIFALPPDNWMPETPSDSLFNILPFVQMDYGLRPEEEAA